LPEGWGGVRKNSFHGGGMDIFWNYTVIIFLEIDFAIKTNHKNSRCFNLSHLNPFESVANRDFP